MKSLKRRRWSPARYRKKPYESTDFQKWVKLVPEHVSVFMGGGRGGGKSVCAAELAANHCEKYRDEASVLILRKGPLKSLRSMISALRKQFNRLWGRGTHRLNMQTYVWTLPTGGHFELGILPDDVHGIKYYEEAYQGNSFGLIIVDEGQGWARPDVLDLLLSNMRHPWIPCRMILLANPGGMGHQWLAQRHVQAALDWNIYRIQNEREDDDGGSIVSSMEWVNCPSTWTDNPHLGSDYPKKLAASTQDPELLKAWLTGNWDISRGAFFAAVLGNRHVKVHWPDRSEWGEEDLSWRQGDWKFWLAMDHGTAAPLVCYVMAGSPGADGPDGVYYPRDSVILVDEYACHRPGDYSKAFGWTIPQLCEPIKDLAKRWRIPARGVADDACFGLMGRRIRSVEQASSLRHGMVLLDFAHGIRQRHKEFG